MGLLIEDKVEENADYPRQKIPDEALRKEEVEAVNRRSTLFDSIFNVKVHEALVARGERRWSHQAFQGALMISFYR